MAWSDGLTIDYAQNQSTAVPRTAVPTTATTTSAAAPTRGAHAPIAPAATATANDPATGLPVGWTGLTAPPGDTSVVAPGTAGTAVDSSGTPGGQPGNYGGGWTNATGTAVGLQKAFEQGLTGQAAVDWANANGYAGIEYYASSGQYGLPDGQYVAPNAQNGQLDLIQKSGSGQGAFSYPTWDQQFSYAPWTQTFTPPTSLTEQNDPGYEERLQLGDQGLLNQNAAQGTLNTTGEQKDIASFNQTFASNEYSNVYGRALTDYQTALQAYQQNYNTAAQQYNQSYQQYLNGYNQAYQSYMGNFGVSNTLNQEGFANQLSLANLGLAGASGTNSAAGQFGNNSANNAYNAGNANAAGAVANANATNQGVANVANGVLPYLGYNPSNPYYGTQSSYQTPYSSSTTSTGTY